MQSVKHPGSNFRTGGATSGGDGVSGSFVKTDTGRTWCVRLAGMSVDDSVIRVI